MDSTVIDRPEIGPTCAIGAAEIVISRCRPAGDGTISVLIREAQGKQEWLLRVKPKSLQSFRAFQAAVAESLGLWCRHYVEGLRAAAARRDWEDEVEHGFNVGARSIPEPTVAA